jgi:hypothetical protein
VPLSHLLLVMYSFCYGDQSRHRSSTINPTLHEWDLPFINERLKQQRNLLNGRRVYATVNNGDEYTRLRKALDSHFSAGGAQISTKTSHCLSDCENLLEPFEELNRRCEDRQPCICCSLLDEELRRSRRIELARQQEILVRSREAVSEHQRHESTKRHQAQQEEEKKKTRREKAKSSGGNNCERCQRVLTKLVSSQKSLNEIYEDPAKAVKIIMKYSRLN